MTVEQDYELSSLDIVKFLNMHVKEIVSGQFSSIDMKKTSLKCSCSKYDVLSGSRPMIIH